jgi:GntR family transcriptional repressor for pyruvate dehydrogenase complex
VRDALRTLEARGLVEVRQGDGAYIRETAPAELYRVMVDLLTSKKETIREIMQVRYILEPGVAYYAAQHVTPDSLQRLEEILQRQEAKAAEGDPGVEEDSSFHYTIAQMTGNGFLMRLLQLINESLVESRDLVLRYPNTQSSSRVGHRKILQALGNHNPKQARQAMLAHIQEVMAAYELLEAET